MSQLTIPKRLYGRDRDLAALLDSLERGSTGHGEVLLVAGAAGVGKTALVQKLELPIRDRNGFFISGKFEQYRQNIPYYAFRQALTQLCRVLQSVDLPQRSRLKADILQSVDGLGRVLTDLVPAFEPFLGPQPPLENISPQEARHRFAGVCRSFLKVICRPEHPLVLFIDDWQWADAASCELLKQIQVGITLHYVLVVVSYRDDEVDPGHRLMSALDDLRIHAVPLHELHVINITADDVRELLADTLTPATNEVDKLAALVHGRTHGNPFFVLSFLSFLHELGLILFDIARNCWHWHIDEIEGADLPGDVVDLFVLRLRRLDPESWNLLSLAACLGNRFELENLSIISGKGPEDCSTLLFSEQTQSLLLPFDGGGGVDPPRDLHVPKTCGFAHDRIQQAAVTLIEPSQLPSVLLRIGRLLLANLHPEQLAERLFEVVSDLNAGCHLIQDTAEQVRTVELNVAAARKAYAATAYGSALQFYRAANRFMEAPGFPEYLWHNRHDLIMHFFVERAECEFLEGEPARAEDCIRQAVAHAETAIEEAAALKVLIVQYTLLARYPEAIAAGRGALNTLGIRLPEDNYEEARSDAIEQVRRQLGTRSISSLIELPVMSHPEMLMASDILITMGPPCYRSHQRLWSVIVPTVVGLTLQYGNIPQVGYSHTAFGGLLGWVDDDYPAAREFGELATRLMTTTFQSPSHQSVFYLMIGSSIRHWFKHLRYATQDYTDAYEIGLRSGNLQYAAYAFGHNMYCRFFQGVPLEQLQQETQRSLAFSLAHRNQWAIDLLQGGLSVFGELSGRDSGLNESFHDSEEEFLRRVAEHQNTQVICIYKVFRTLSLLVLGEYSRALLLSNEVEPLIFTAGTQGLLPWPEHVFARFMILSALYPDAHAEQQAEWRTELDLMIARFRIWAVNCPENFQHKYLLAAAELARIDRRPVDAMGLYDAAAEAAQAGSFLQWEGLANERAYGFLLERGHVRLAQVYWQHAYACYDRWGAVAKVCSMEASYRTCLAEDLLPGQPAEHQEQEIRDVLVEKQIERLRSFSLQMQQARLRVEATAQADELADAMRRVRVEIAERKRTEEALRESERLLKESQVVASLGSFVLDASTGVWTSSEVLDSVLGIDPAYERSVEGWAALIHPDDRAFMVDYLRDEVLGHGESLDKEYRIVRHDNQAERWVHGLGKVESDDHGRTQAMHGTIQDITARKQTEAQRDQLIQELQEALAKVKSLTGLLPICAGCKKIRDDRGYWSQVESFIETHSEATFSHGMCPDCIKKWWPELKR